MTCTYLPEATFSQHLDEMEVFYHVLPEAWNRPRGGREPPSFPEQIVCRRLFCEKLSERFDTGFLCIKHELMIRCQTREFPML